MSDVEMVSCGKDYTLVLSKIGHVYAFGLNTMQQMTGLKQNAYSQPKRIKHTDTIVQLCASTSNKTHGMILGVDQTVWIGSQTVRVEKAIQVS